MNMLLRTSLAVLLAAYLVSVGYSAPGDKISYVTSPRFSLLSSSTQTKLNLKLNTSVFNAYTSIDRVPATRTVNGHALTSNITVTASDVGAPSGSGNSTGTNTGDVTIGTANGLSLSGQQINLQAATNSVPGALTAADHATFAGKQDALGYTPMKTDYSNAGSPPTWNQNTTGSAAKLTTARTIGITGPITWTSPSFDGSGNVTAAATVSAQTGTGSTFVMQASPQFTGDVGIGMAPAAVANYTSLDMSGTTGNFIRLYSGAVEKARIQTDGTDLDISNFGTGVLNLSTNGHTITIDASGNVSINGGTNIIYYCNGGASVGNLCRGNGCSCSGGSWVATNLKL